MPGGTLICTVQAIDLAERGLLVSKKRDGTDITLTVVEVSDGEAEYAGRRFPVDPIVGVMGVAPAEGEIPNSTPGPHGGNLDTRDVGIGSRLYLPVAQEGGLLPKNKRPAVSIIRVVPAMAAPAGRTRV